MTTEPALARRMDFMRLDSQARAVLAGLQPQIAAALPATMEAFYAQVRAAPEVARLFKGDAHLAAARSAQLKHWEHIASGAFDAAYFESVRRIGAVHARIGLEPQWYVGGYASVLTGLLAAILRSSAGGRSWGRKDRTDRVVEQVSAVVKAALLDMEISISVYLEASEEARRAAEAERAEAQAQQTRVVEETARALSALAGGDLTFSLDDRFPADYEKLRVDLNAAVSHLHETMALIVANAQSMTHGAGEITQAADDLSRRTEQQAASLEETAAALDQVTATVKRTADAAAEATELVLSAQGHADSSAEVVGAAVNAMNGIERSSSEISQIIGVIDEIAFQTNLLALNAGVEAARAGEAGKGFAVVASEVRALAQRSAEAAKEIKTLINTSSQHVGRGVDLVGRTGQALQKIAEQVKRITDVVQGIAASAREQSTGLTEVNLAVNQMDQMTQQNAAMVEESTAASHALSREARELLQLMASFRLSEAAVEGRRAPVQAPPARAASGGGAIRLVANGAPAADAWTEF